MTALPGTPSGHTWRLPRIGVVRLSLLLLAALAVASWGYVLLGSRTDSGVLVAPHTWSRVWVFARSLLGFRTEIAPRGNPRVFLDASSWLTMARLAYQTLAMSVLAIWFAAIGMALTVMAGARPRDDGTTRRPARIARWAAFGVVRTAWVVTRGIPELVWAMLLVFVLPPGILAGAVALGLHNFGIVGKLCSEVVESLDPRPARALRANGAGAMQTLAYAVLPQALPQFLTFALYRWEVIIRTTIVVGFVSAGGLGREFRLAMSFFHYTNVLQILATYFLLVIFVDLVSTRLRRLAQ